MKKSSYQSVFPILLIFIVVTTVMMIASVGILFYITTLQTPSKQTVFSNYPKNIAENFSNHLSFFKSVPKVTQDGIHLLEKNNAWLQIIDPQGNEILAYYKPNNIPAQYSSVELLHLYQSDAIFANTITQDNQTWTYIIGFPFNLSKIIMYVNGSRFSSGKVAVILLLLLLLFSAFVSSILYSVWLTRRMSVIRKTLKEISLGNYSMLPGKGVFADVHHDLNTLKNTLCQANRMREKTKKEQEAWIANITHDLKTPLSPIKGYAELLAGQELTADKSKSYGEIILKNTTYIQSLVEDLKITYQLQNGIFPIAVQNHNLVRFVRELIIDLINDPAYEEREITFKSTEETLILPFDKLLLKRALGNLLVNALIHNSIDTKVSVTISKSDCIQIQIQDNGAGMSQQLLEKLFTRYYTETDEKTQTQHTGLGLSIAKQIIEAHGGRIDVKSILKEGTTFMICFPIQN